jgi:hypothetical protein
MAQLGGEELDTTIEAQTSMREEEDKTKRKVWGRLVPLTAQGVVPAPAIIELDFGIFICLSSVHDASFKGLHGDLLYYSHHSPILPGTFILQIRNHNLRTHSISSPHVLQHRQLASRAICCSAARPTATHARGTRIRKSHRATLASSWNHLRTRIKKRIRKERVAQGPPPSYKELWVCTCRI